MDTHPEDINTTISTTYKRAPASEHGTKYPAQFINKVLPPIIPIFKNYIYSAGQWWHTLLNLGLGRQRQTDI